VRLPAPHWPGGRWTLVVIGGGVRFDPAQTPVLEALVNVVIEAAPGVRIAFNTSPTDTAEAIARAS